MKPIVLAVCAGLYCASFVLPVTTQPTSGDEYSLDRMSGAAFFKTSMPGGAGAKGTVLLLLAWAANPIFWAGLGALGVGNTYAACILGVSAAAIGFGGAVGALGIDFLKVAGIGFWLWIGAMAALGGGAAAAGADRRDFRFN